MAPTPHFSASTVSVNAIAMTPRRGGEISRAVAQNDHVTLGVKLVTWYDSGRTVVLHVNS